MPATEVRVFRDEDGRVYMAEWLDELETREPEAHAKCLARILELAEKGNEMRRPHSDLLRDGIYELRATTHRIHYRILYFFFDKHAVALSHGTVKQDRVPPRDINLACQRKKLVLQSPNKYTADFED